METSPKHSYALKFAYVRIDVTYQVHYKFFFHGRDNNTNPSDQYQNFEAKKLALDKGENKHITAVAHL